MKLIIRFLLLVNCSLFFGCGQEPIDLGHRYQYFTTNADNHYIIQGNQFIVDSNIVEYKIVSHFIVGLRQPSEHPDGGGNSKNYGYFVLDMNTGDLTEALDLTDIYILVQGQTRLDDVSP